MGLGIRVEGRTGYTPHSRRKRQRADPPEILLTTPESLALLLSQKEAPRLFAGLGRVVVDEVHALAGAKRGDQLALSLARLTRLAPGHDRSALGHRRRPGRHRRMADILYDALRRHDSGHLMLRATRAEAMRGLVDFGRIEEMLAGAAGRIDHVVAERVTPLAAPLLLEIGQVPIRGLSAEEALIVDEASLAADLRSEG